MERIGEENIGLLLDTFHMNIEEKSIEKAIDTAGDKLFHFHACENDRGYSRNWLDRMERCQERSEKCGLSRLDIN